MEKHPKAGKPVKIPNGLFKGRYFLITDFLVNQFQGKAIQRIAKVHSGLVEPVLKRGFPLDDQIVLGRLYPEMKLCCVHDKELQVDMQVVGEDEELPPNVENIKPKKKKGKKKDDAGTTN